MAETPALGDRPRREGATVKGLDARRVGHQAKHFGRWYLQNRFKLMQGFLSELERGPGERDSAELRTLFLATVRHGQRVQMARTVVTVLLAFSVVAAAASSLLDQAGALNETALARFFQGPVEEFRALMLAVQAVSTSAALLLLVARLAMDRYLELVATSASFTAMQIAAEPREHGELRRGGAAV